MNCPKCGGENSMRGPRYVNGNKGERLVTRCRVCKYTTSRLCADVMPALEGTGVVKIIMPPGEDQPK